MNEKSVVRLQKNAHLAQLLGVVDKDGNYCATSSVAQTLCGLPKIEIEDENKLDIIGEYISLQSEAAFDGKPLFFRVEIERSKNEQCAIVFLQETAEEMGGLIAFTYLTPLAVFESNNSENFLIELYENFQIENGSASNEANITKLDAHIKKRNEKRRTLEAEAERLSRTAMARINKVLPEPVKNELTEIKQAAKRFTRAGKPNYNQSQAQMVKHIIEHNSLQESDEVQPAMQIIKNHEQRIEKVAQKILGEEIAAGIEPAAIQRIPSGGKQETSQPKTRRDAIIGKLPAMERAAIMGSRLDFGKLLTRVKGGSKQRANPLKLLKDAPKKREQFEKEYEKKAPRVTKIINAVEEVKDEEVGAVAVPDTENEINKTTLSTEKMDTHEQIEQIVAKGLKDYVYKTETKKTALTITQKTERAKESEQGTFRE